VKAGALAGVRVLDLADESAAFAGRILADLGADVLIETAAVAFQIGPGLLPQFRAERASRVSKHALATRLALLNTPSPEPALRWARSQLD